MDSDEICWTGRSFSSSYTLDRPYGIREQKILFLHFRSAAEVGVDREKSRPGACIFFSPQEPQYFRGESESGNKMLAIDGLLINSERQAEILELGLPMDKVFYPKRTDYIPVLFQQIQAEVKNELQFWERVRDHAISLVLILLGRFSPSEGRAIMADTGEDFTETLRGLCRQVDENPGRDWSVEDMAKAVDLSRPRFSSLFREFTGEMPRDYLINARLRHAIIMLTNGSYSMADIAERSGFHSPYYFSRIFSKRIGCPPSHYNDRFMIR